MKNLNLLFVIFLIFVSQNFSFAQTIDARIQEVYGDKTQELLANDPDRLRFLNELLASRISLELSLKDLSTNSSITKLSEVELYNKYNQSLVRDINFNPETFNPLKYNLSFYSFSKEPVIYRIDNTDYIIVIKPQLK